MVKGSYHIVIPIPNLNVAIGIEIASHPDKPRSHAETWSPTSFMRDGVTYTGPERETQHNGIHITIERLYCGRIR
jgi:hypothetical protein